MAAGAQLTYNDLGGWSCAAKTAYFVLSKKGEPWHVFSTRGDERILVGTVGGEDKPPLLPLGAPLAEHLFLGWTISDKAVMLLMPGEPSVLARDEGKCLVVVGSIEPLQAAAGARGEKRNWTEEEDALLLKAIAENTESRGPKWARVSEAVGRSAHACRNRQKVIA